MVAQTTTIRTPLVAEIRDAMEGLAVKHLNGATNDGWVQLHLADRRPDLNVWDRWALWEDLCTAYTNWDQAEGGDVERMRAALDEQLDTLVDGYVARTADGQ